MDLTFPLGYKVCEWISPSPWEGREERAGKAISFRSIPDHRAATDEYCVTLPCLSFLLSDLP